MRRKSDIIKQIMKLFYGQFLLCYIRDYALTTWNVGILSTHITLGQTTDKDRLCHFRLSRNEDTSGAPHGSSVHQCYKNLWKMSLISARLASSVARRIPNAAAQVCAISWLKILLGVLLYIPFRPVIWKPAVLLGESCKLPLTPG